MHTKNFGTARMLMVAPASGGSVQASRLNPFVRLEMIA